jgi:hypothetical protein
MWRARRNGPALRRLAARLLLFLGLLSLCPEGAAMAHGGGTLRLSNAPVGPYRLSIWTQPDVLRVGEVHLTLGVTEPGPEGSLEAGPPILDATVVITARPLSGGEIVELLASRDNAANKLFYEADFELDQPGTWRFDVQVSGPQGGGAAGFESDVSPPSALNVPLLAGVGVILAVVAWLFMGRRRSGSVS